MDERLRGADNHNYIITSKRLETTSKLTIREADVMEENIAQARTARRGIENAINLIIE